MQIGERLRGLIRESGMKIVEVADMCGIHASTLSTYLSGRKRPCLWTLVRICHVLGVTLDDALNGVEEWEIRRGRHAVKNRPACPEIVQDVSEKRPA
jgi:transcriptional regulator with XRE-family HTH domain